MRRLARANALAGTARPINKERDLFTGVAGQAVATPLLQEPDCGGVVVKCLSKEGEPKRAVACRVEPIERNRRGGGDLADVVIRLARPDLASQQVYGSAGCAKQHCIAVPCLRGAGKLPDRPSPPFHMQSCAAGAGLCIVSQPGQHLLRSGGYSPGCSVPAPVQIKPGQGHSIGHMCGAQAQAYAAQIGMGKGRGLAVCLFRGGPCCRVADRGQAPAADLGFRGALRCFGSLTLPRGAQIGRVASSAKVTVAACTGVRFGVSRYRDIGCFLAQAVPKLSLAARNRRGFSCLGGSGFGHFGSWQNAYNLLISNEAIPPQLDKLPLDINGCCRTPKP